MGEDMEYAMAMLAHASAALPLESEELLAQFRNARFEEDGFVLMKKAYVFFKRSLFHLDLLV